MTARLSLAQNLFGSLVDRSRDFFWSFQRRKMAGRQSISSAMRKPSWVIISANDRMLPPAMEQVAKKFRLTDEQWKRIREHFSGGAHC
jgi:hypothetical protein